MSVFFGFFIPLLIPFALAYLLEMAADFFLGSDVT